MKVEVVTPDDDGDAIGDINSPARRDRGHGTVVANAEAVEAIVPLVTCCRT